MKKLLSLLIVLALYQPKTQAQCLMAPVTLSQRVSQSSLVIEGKVLNSQSFWNAQHDHIFTSSLVEVYKSFKGSAPAYVEVITEGGTVGNDMHEVHPSLELGIGDAGVFTLNASAEAAQFGKPAYEAYASSQGFIKYSVADNYATEPFQKYLNLSSTFYTAVQQATGASYTVIKNTNAFAQATPGFLVQNVMAITGFSPTTITAGTFSVLTINGSGFGASTGTVSFANADDGGATYINAAPSQITSWSNTQITVQVPTGTSISGTAGTGVVKVNGVASSQTLTISYGHLNVANSGTVYNTQHVGPNSGGYTWIYNSSFITNAPAKAAFERSFTTWRCNTYINWQLSGSTTTISAAASDGSNVVTFETGMPAGVLGRCTSYWSGCGSGATMKWFVSELDISFAPSPGGLTWQYGPTAPTSSQYDFESVTVHELGHGHQLSHVINSTDLMHYALSNGQSKRTLNTDDLNGGLAVMARNTAATACGQTIMTALTSGNCAIGAPTASFTANRTTVCPGQAVAFTDMSTGGPSAWSWSFAGGTPSTSSVQNPTITYNTPGTYSVSLTASNANGTNTYSVLAYINVITTASLPLVEGFQAATFPPVNWYTVDGGNDNVKWALSTSAGQASTQSAVFDNFTTDVTGTRDELKTYVNLGSVTNAKMTFYRAYGLTFNSPNIDTLEIRISTNCGASTTQAYYKGGSQIGTGSGNGTTIFVPTSAQWAKDSIDLTPYVGNSSVMVSIINRSHYGDGMYLDNINISSVTPSTVVPTATISASSNSVCVGQSLTLTNTSTGSPGTYAWSMTGGTPASASTSSTSVTYSSAGVKTISLTVSSGTLSSTSTKTITVFASPTVSATPTSTAVCSGQAVTLTGSGATTYAWAPGGQTTASVSVNPTALTVYTVTGTTSGCSATANVTVAVNAAPAVSISGASSSCSGNAVTLTASGATSYTWAPGGQLTASVSVTPASTTVYTVTGATSGCSATASQTLTVGTSPTITATPASTAVCSGNAATLSASGATSYTWMPGNLSGASVSVNPSSPTVYTVTGATSGCSATKTVAVGVSTTPTISVSGPSGICTGGSAILSATGAPSLTWTPAGQNTTSVTVSPSSTTVYTVTANNAGCMATATKTLVVTAIPSVSVNTTNTTVCSGSNISLTASGATSYTWNPGNLTTATAIVSPTTTITYTVVGSTNGCTGSNTSVVGVLINPTITVTSSTTTACAGQNVVLSGHGGSSYTWTPGNLSGGNVTVTPTVTTTYSVVGTNGSSCSANASILINILTCTGIDELSASSGVAVYPNPNNGEFTVLNSSEQAVTMTVYNTVGQVVVSGRLNKDENRINVSSFGKGVYYVQLSNSGFIRTVKLVVE